MALPPGLRKGIASVLEAGGWYMMGLDPAGGSWNAPAPSTIMKHQGTGRVRLSRFYAGGAKGDWTLSESVSIRSHPVSGLEDHGRLSRCTLALNDAFHPRADAILPCSGIP